MRHRALWLAAGLLLAVFLWNPLHAQVAPQVQDLAIGQRIKVEGRLRQHMFIADKVEPAPTDDDFEVEAMVANLTRDDFKFIVGSLTVRVFPETRVENSLRETASFARISQGARVAITARKMEAGEVHARRIRSQEDSADTDFEIEGPIERIDPARSQIVLVATTVQMDRRTRFRVEGLPQSTEYWDDMPSSRIRRDDDEQHPEPLQIGNVLIGGTASSTHERTRETDLRRSVPDPGDWLFPTLGLELSAPLSGSIEAYTRLEFTRQTYFGNDPGERTGDGFAVSGREAFLFIRNVIRPELAVQIGRQRFRDKRKFAFDDQLDAVRLYFKKGRFQAEAAVAKTIIEPSGSLSDQLYVIAHSTSRFPDRRYLYGYVIKRNDVTSRDEDPLWYGVHSRGHVIGGVNYWLELCRMAGRKAGTKLSGYGYDAGGSIRLPVPLKPALSAGYAYGSGDNDFNDGVDGNFRQTALQDNSLRYQGLKRFNSYGVLFDPELSNLGVGTLNFGLNPLERWSVDLSLHQYRQAVPHRKLGDSELRVDPNGRDPRLGKEIDAVVAIRMVRNVDLNFQDGFFFAGPAFSRSAASPVYFKQEVRFYF